MTLGEFLTRTIEGKMHTPGGDDMTRTEAWAHLIHVYEVPLLAPESILTSDLVALCEAFETLYHAIDELEDAREVCARTHGAAAQEERP